MTADEIKTNIATKPNWAERAIVRLGQEQDADEIAMQSTSKSNGFGFNSVDAFILTSFYKQIIAGRHLSEKQLAIAYRKLPKYAKQLERLSK